MAVKCLSGQFHYSFSLKPALTKIRPCFQLPKDEWTVPDKGAGPNRLDQTDNAFGIHTMAYIRALIYVFRM